MPGGLERLAEAIHTFREAGTEAPSVGSHDIGSGLRQWWKDTQAESQGRRQLRELKKRNKTMLKASGASGHLKRIGELMDEAGIKTVINYAEDFSEITLTWQESRWQRDVKTLDGGTYVSRREFKLMFGVKITPHEDQIEIAAISSLQPKKDYAPFRGSWSPSSDTRQVLSDLITDATVDSLALDTNIGWADSDGYWLTKAEKERADEVFREAMRKADEDLERWRAEAESDPYIE